MTLIKRPFLLSLSFFFLSLLPMIAEDGKGVWNSFLSYYSTEEVEDAGDVLYFVASGSLVAYDKEYDSFFTYDRTNGLNDSNIAAIRFVEGVKKLLIVYENGNVDILNDEGTYNIPYLKNNTSIQDKSINRIDVIGDYAYISAAFGVLVVDMVKDEFKDLYRLGVNTFSVTLHKDYIYAATAVGISKALLTDNLIDKGNWHSHPCNTSLFDSKKVRGLFDFNGNLVFYVPGKGLFREANGLLDALLKASSIHAAMLEGDVLFALCSVHFYMVSGSEAPKKVGFAAMDVAASRNSSLWLACGTKGALCIKKDKNNAYKAEGEPKILNSPRTNSPYKLLFANDKLHIAAGGKTTSGTGFGSQGIVMEYEKGQWTFTDQTSVKKTFGVYMKDYTSLAIHPSNKDVFYAASFGYGLARFEKGKATALFNNKNSTIESILPGKMDYDRIDGLAFDKKGNLWMTNSEVQNAIKVLDADGKWHSIYNRYLSKQYTLNNILITSSEKKWFNIPRVNPSIVVFDDAGTLDIASDDKSVLFQSFTDTDGKAIQASSYMDMVEDKDGYVWVASNVGPLCFRTPDKALSAPESFRAVRIKMENEDGSLFYFMEGIKVTCIEVDAANQKWFGTESNGVYVLDASNTEIVHHFDTENSPLLSNNIYSIDSDPQTGTVFIGTDKGLVSYKSDAVEGKKDFSNVYVYPNPVRPEMNDKVVIAGLMDNSRIKITDLNGNLLHETKSIGGQASWNCRTAHNERVPSGIYLVLASNNDGEGVVAKIMVISQ